ncbi:eCIS core domain-containing protein [Hymenobacter cellulosivorans]|uniref:DUF4157 domain-containing protein n=1 Tax=Hymenobacter cellulosivorans TaxID=2932249 RepID=A0ABY4F7V1_9BACT|nr:DUF4157 domain-containing protein [Hymenobacter cellulosivorans]UOQ52182.1 DUF4157 domain-containing protein [Hymenobacter cellulosivorans]
MTTHADQAPEKQSLPRTATTSTQPTSRRAAPTQLRSRESSAAGPRQTADSTSPLQALADGSPQVQQAAQLQASADAYVARQPLQRRENRTGLPDGLKAGVESLSGHSLDEVRVHYNSSKPAQLQAYAYAQGSDIHLAPGQEQHLPHEAWHVVQQKQGRVQATRQLQAGVPVNDETGLEHEADVMGAKAAGLVQRQALADLISGSSAAAAVVQRVEDIVSQVVVTGGVVTSASLPSLERTEGVLGGIEGSHTTPWSVLVATVRMAVEGKTLANAVAALTGLFTAAEALPGVNRVEFMMGNQQIHYAQAHTKVTQARVAANHAPTQDNLQRFMSAYLEYRNVIPFSAVDVGGLANYNNEAPRLECIRNYNTETSQSLKAAILELLDPKTVAKLGQVIDHTEAAYEEEGLADDDERPRQVNSDVPGADFAEEIEPRLADLIMQHLQTMKAGFPEAYYKANITLADILNRFFPQPHLAAVYHSDEENSSDDDAPALNRATFNQTFVLPGRGVVRPLRPDIGTNNAGGVQLRMNDNGTIGRALINTQDRPDGLFGTADKKHATAWVVFVSGVRKAVVGKTLTAAVTALNTLYDAAYRLPGTSKAYLLPPTRLPQWRDAMGAVDQAKEAADAAATINSVQTYIRAYLRFRNFIPLSAADIPGAGPGGHAEATAIGIVETPDAHEPVVVRDAVYELLDPGVVWAFALGQGRTAQGYDQEDAEALSSTREYTDQGDLIDKEVPGAMLNISREARAAQVIKQHLETIRVNFPDAYARGDVNSQASIENFLAAKLPLLNESARRVVSNKVRA